MIVDRYKMVIRMKITIQWLSMIHIDPYIIVHGDPRILHPCATPEEYIPIYFAAAQSGCARERPCTPMELPSSPMAGPKDIREAGRKEEALSTHHKWYKMK